MLHSTQLHTWLKPLGIALACCFFSTLNAQEVPVEDTEPSSSSVLDAFPAPQSGYQRHVIHLPIGNYENNLKIELLAGKVQEMDCNPSHYSGQFEEKTLEGWGYNYYELKNLEGPVSNKMACPDDKLSLQFVPVQSNGSLLQYNSNLPVVVYLPQGLELRWRTWVATPYNTAITE
ncbi:serine protease inhibitor ecotin [Paenalcaligenes hominis]|uniref:serine protease inhibitor ecotin n=1 Tax=Paenalcaligenes hominis TaxID=643674 RepID=UPI0035267672